MNLPESVIDLQNPPQLNLDPNRRLSRTTPHFQEAPHVLVYQISICLFHPFSHYLLQPFPTRSPSSGKQPLSLVRS